MSFWTSLRNSVTHPFAKTSLEFPLTMGASWNHARNNAENVGLAIADYYTGGATSALGGLRAKGAQDSTLGRIVDYGGKAYALYNMASGVYGAAAGGAGSVAGGAASGAGADAAGASSIGETVGGGSAAAAAGSGAGSAASLGGDAATTYPWSDASTFSGAGTPLATSSGSTAASNLFSAGQAAPIVDASTAATGATTSLGTALGGIPGTLAESGSSLLGGGGGYLGMAKNALGVYGGLQNIRAAHAMGQQQLDPFAQYRQGYGAQLQALNANPSSVAQLPGYQFGMQQGEQGIQRSMAAQGYTGSGNAAIALQGYDQTYAGQQFAAQQQYLAGLAGAGIGPSPNMQNQWASQELQNQGMGQIGATIGGWNSPSYGQRF